MGSNEWCASNLKSQVANVEGAAAPGPELPRTEWRFDQTMPEAGSNQGWQAGPGVAGLGVREDRLAGTTTSATPIVHVTRTTGLQDFDLLHSVEIRMRASAGANLRVIFRHGDELDINEARQTLQLLPWGATPIVAGDEVLTYTVTSPFPATSPDIQYIVLQPTASVPRRLSPAKSCSCAENGIFTASPKKNESLVLRPVGSHRQDTQREGRYRDHEVHHEKVEPVESFMLHAG